MPSLLTENEIADKHVDALGQARRACQYLGRNADPEYIGARGIHYGRLKDALDELEGSARQMATIRSDARWLRLGILYGGRIKRAAQQKFVGQKWQWFNDLMPLFENGMKQMADLRDTKTGVLSSQPILPSRPSDWLVLPDLKIPKAPSRHIVN